MRCPDEGGRKVNPVVADPEWLSKVLKTLEHNLRGPIGLAKSAAEILAWEDDRPEYRRIRAQATAALDLLDNLLLDYRIRTKQWGKVPCELEWSEIREAIHEEVKTIGVNEELSIQWFESGLDATARGALLSRFVDVDLPQFLQALRCLVRFGVRESPASIGRLELRYGQRGVELLLALSESKTWQDAITLETQQVEFTTREIGIALKLLELIGVKTHFETPNCLVIRLDFRDNR